MPYVLIVGLNILKVRCRIKIVLKQILSQMLVSSLAKIKRLQIHPGYFSTYDQSSPILKGTNI